MSTHKKRARLIIAGVIGLAALCMCGCCPATLAEVGSLTPGPQAGTVPQPAVAISVDNMDRVELVYTFSPRPLLQSSKWEMEALAWSPDRRLLAVGGNADPLAYMGKTRTAAEDPLKLWDLTTGRAVPLPDLPGNRVCAVAFSPDGQWMAATRYGGITLWNLDHGQVIRTIQIDDWGEHYPTGHIAFSPDSGRIFARLQDAIQSWDVGSSRPLTRLDGYYDMFLTQGGETLVWSHPPDREWPKTLSELATGREVWKTNENPVALSDNGEFLAQRTNPPAEFAQTQLTLVDLTNGHALREWQSFPYNSNVAFSPDSTLIVTPTDERGLMHFFAPAYVSISDLQSGKTRKLRDDSAQLMAFSPDGRLLAIAERDGTVELWGIKP